MRVVPKTRTKQLSFFQVHVAKWAETYAEIGLTSEEVADIEAKLAAAKEAFKAQQIAQNEARTATSVFYRAMDALTTAGGSAILKVRATARLDGVKVYPLASLPKPKKASPIAAPGKPTSFKVALSTLGQIELSWKCKNPANADGTMYEVQRSIGDGEFEFLGVAGKKRFTDSTIPAGTALAIYRITAFRSTKRGPVATFNVSLGVGAGDAQLLALVGKRAA